jgi:hypothetical protein
LSFVVPWVYNGQKQRYKITNTSPTQRATPSPNHTPKQPQIDHQENNDIHPHIYIHLPLYTTQTQHYTSPSTAASPGSSSSALPPRAVRFVAQGERCISIDVLGYIHRPVFIECLRGRW